MRGRSGGSCFEVSLGKILQRPCLEKKTIMEKRCWSGSKKWM
jgi:hypothetical protein